MASDQVRVSFGFRPDTYKRLQEVCEKLDISQAKLFECFLLMDTESIIQVVKENLPVIAENRKKRLAARRILISKLGDMTPAEVESLLSEKNDA